jgi:hypothetical protein
MATDRVPGIPVEDVRQKSGTGVYPDWLWIRRHRAPSAALTCLVALQGD